VRVYIDGKQVEVEVRGMRTRARLTDLRRPGPNAGDGRAGSRGQAAAGSARRVQVTTAPREASAARELVVVGSTVDQAIDRAAKFLDDALMADETRLRVVHGHGTGKLREALTRFFREHPLVASVSPASDREGGGGATIVELKA
jgi:DNA mismatch repair protein MutS2